MAEELQEQQSGFNFKYYLGVAKRRHMLFLVPLLVGWLAVWGLSWTLPSRYRSGTLILVEQPAMPKEYVTPNINDDLQSRLQSITQQILSRTRLLHIIEQLNLYADSKKPMSADEKVERMRDDIKIELVRNQQNEVSSFNVYFTARDPHTAQSVTNELTQLFISKNLEVRQQQSEDTTKFLEEQLEAARKTLADQEEKVREFKALHPGELPTQLTTNLQILQGLQNQLQSDEDALNTAKQQRVYLETMVNQYRTMSAPAKGVGGTAAPVGLAGIDDQLDKLRAQLADLNSHYTEKHPDVRKVKEQIAKTEKMRDQLVAAMQAKASATPEQDASDSSATDPKDATLVQFQGQLRANKLEIANRERSIGELKTKINDYQARLTQEPIREQQLSDLTRGYDQSKANYDDLLKKKNESAMATRVEMLQQGERFRILDPPSLPGKPDYPNRLKFCGMGLFVGLAMGTLLAGAFEMFDDRIYDEKKLEALLPVGVISEIPPITVPSDDRKEQRRMLLGWATACIVFAAILLGSAISYLRG